MTGPVLSSLDAPALRANYERGYWQDRTIYGYAQAWAGAAPDRVAVRERQRVLTYAELVDAADALAADLYRRGVRAGQRIAVWLPTRIETVVALLAASRSGVVCCPSPHRSHTVAEVVSLMERMRAAALIYQAGFGADSAVRDIAAAVADLESLRHVYRLDPAAGATSIFDGALDRSTSDESGVEISADPDRVTYLAFTSGSTGTPKGVMHSDNTQLVTARAIVADWGLDESTVIYSMSPMNHNLGVGSFLTCLVAGGTFVIHDLPRGESLVDRLIETGATYLVGVPTHAIDLLGELERRERGVLSRVKGFRISGAATPPHVMDRLLALGITPQSGYGMTETNAHQYTLPGDDASLIRDTCGRSCAGYQTKIWDADDPDVELPPGQIGQLGGRGASLMLGYFDDQVSTENAFNAEGWFMTGDLGWIGEDGYLRLTGRIKEVIIRGGHNINPAKIEALALKHGSVLHAAAVPIPDKRLGEKVCLAVMARRDRSIDPADLLSHLAAAGLSRYDMPEYFMTLDDFPLMPNGKVRKLVLMDWMRDGAVAPEPVPAQSQKEV